MAINKKRELKSEFRSKLEGKLKEDAGNIGNFNISFQDYNSAQRPSQSFKDWQNIGLLSTALDILKNYCCSPLLSQLDGHHFALYGGFPPDERTMFGYPHHVTPDANWARIRIANKSVIIGHIVGNTFYLVFLDKKHDFYLTNRKLGIK